MIFEYSYNPLHIVILIFTIPGIITLQPDVIQRAGLDTVTTKFVSGHLKNNQMLEKSFLYVEKLGNSSFSQQSINQSKVELQWDVILVDTDLETKIQWCRRNHILGESTVEVQWSISSYTEPGNYRIRHVGSFKVPYLGFRTSYIQYI